MNILITGGAGYVGYSVVRSLLDDVDNLHSITIYDNLSRNNYSFFTEARFDNKPVRLIQADILDSRTLAQALEGIDCVIHLAAKVTTPADDSDAHTFDQVNQWGSAQVAMAIERSNVKRVVYVSSIAVYGHGDEHFTEASNPNPFSVYGRSKLDGERQIDVLASQRELYILRSANVYGYNPAYRIDAVINKFMFNANFHRRIQVYGSGEQVRSFVHVDKLAGVIVGAVDAKLKPKLYNVVEHELSINDLADRIGLIYPDLEVIHVHRNLKPRDVKAYIPCLLEAELGYFDGVSFHEELLAFKGHFSF